MLLSLSMTNAQASTAPPSQGMVTAVDVSSRTIQINQNVYALSDTLPVISPNGNLLNQGAIQVGQNVQYSIESSPNLGPQASSLPPQMVSQINILNGYSENGLKK